MRYLVRETYFSSLDLTQQTLAALGVTRAEAKHNIEKFREIDERALQSQLAFRDDEQKLIQSAQLVAKELERLLDSDAELARLNEVADRSECIAAIERSSNPFAEAR